MPRDAGFSLVEMMAAMFIAAIAAMAVVVAIPPAVPEAEQAAQRLAAALTRAQRAAVTEGAPIGLILAADSYRFAVWDGERWRDLDRASGLGPQAWPDDVLVGVRADAMSDEASGAAPQGFPVLVFDEAGGATPFVIRIDGDGAATVRGDAMGGIAMEAAGA